MEYKLSDIAKITGGTLKGCDQMVYEVVTDSRGSVAGSNSIFVAMQGVNHDSHDYISQMANRGVVAFMVEDESFGAIANISYVVVENSITALQKLAADHRSRFLGLVVGITGSNGKTIVKEWIAQSASKALKIFRSPRSYNSQLGVALSLLMIEGDEDLALIEAGVSQPNEMINLEEMIQPDIAIITSIGEAHQEGFVSMEQKIEEKMVLATRAQRVIYNSDYKELIPHILYASRGSRSSYIDAAEFPKGNFTDIASQRNWQIVAALHHTLSLSAPIEEDITPVAMRLEMIEGINGSTIINDSYNSDINSLIIALDTLQATASGGATTVILSDILQSGISSEELYRGVASAIKRAKVDQLIGVGAEIAKWSELFLCSSKFYATTEELISQITAEDYADRTILLKGNRKSRFEKISHLLAHQSHTTTLEVNLNSMVHNLNLYRAHLSPKTKLVAMVKASSYGAGEVEIAQTLQYEGVDYLAVAFADEGSRLRERGITMPIIVLNADDGSFSQMVDNKLEPEIYSFKSLKAFASAVSARGERDYPIHIKIDSGMHRLGFMEGDIAQLNMELSQLKGVITVASIFSHLSSADMGEAGEEKTEDQIDKFDTMSSEIQTDLDYPTLRHIANSAGIIKYPEAHFDMCRLGIGLYGFGHDDLTPISTLKSRIVQIRELTVDQPIGYGGAGRTKRNSKIATIPIGYADGLNRHLGCGAWSVIINGEKAPTIGRICMDSCMIDITDIKGVNEGDEVTIFSPQKTNTAEDIAKILDTISYEVLTSVSKRVKRIYLKE
ncbi:MAG: alanine racemase [Rikenellaceae bacterium]